MPVTCFLAPPAQECLHAGRTLLLYHIVIRDCKDESSILGVKSKAMFEKKGSATPVRLTEDEKNQLARIASDTGLTSSTLIRLLISSLVAHYRENGNTITLPLQWTRLIAEQKVPTPKAKRSSAPGPR